MDKPNPKDRLSRLEAFRAWWWSTPYRMRILWCFMGQWVLLLCAYVVIWILAEQHGATMPDATTGEIYPINVGFRHSSHAIYTTQHLARISGIINDLNLFNLGLVLLLGIVGKLIGLKRPQ
jgi:hypothetical protein